MKHRVKLAVLSVVISLMGTALVLVQNRQPIRTLVVNVPAQPTAVVPTAVVATEVVPTAVMPAKTPTVSTRPITSEKIVEGETVDVPSAGTIHTAQRGETVNGLAVDMQEKDTRAYRQAILDANPSLKANPDKLVAGKSYVMPPVADAAVIPADAPVEAVAVTPAPKVGSREAKEVNDAKPELKYTAVAGDTVTSMSAAFLGSEDQAHQATIVDANGTLQVNADKVVVGKSYKIPVPDGLTATASTGANGPSTRPSAQPDSDTVIAASAPRTLRYTARAGDTVTSMAAALLGSDTLANQTVIINANPSLQRDRDRLITGQTYAIPAPSVTP